MIVRVVVAAEPETFTELDEKLTVAAMDESALTEKVTGPLKPFAGVTVKVIPAAVAPELTSDETVHGVSPKSALLEETKSPLRVPFDAV